MLSLVQDEPALRAGAANGILDKTYTRHACDRHECPWPSEPPPTKVIEHWGAKLEQQNRPGRGATPERMLVKCRTRQLAGSSQSQIRQRACVSTGVAERLRMVPSCPICDRYTLFVAPDGLRNRPYSVGVLPLPARVVITGAKHGRYLSPDRLDVR